RGGETSTGSSAAPAAGGQQRRSPRGPGRAVRSCREPRKTVPDSQLENESLAGDDRARQLLFDLAADAVEHLVVVLRIVVEHDQLLHPNDLTQTHTFLPNKVPPADE